MHHGRVRVQPPQICKKRRHGRVSNETGAEILSNGAAQPEDIFPKPIDPDRQRKRVGFLPVDLPPEDPRRVVTTKIKAESTSKKLTPEDLRATLLDFGKTAKFLRERRPGLHDQLVDTAHRVFKTINLPGNRTARFEDYEH